MRLGLVEFQGPPIAHVFNFRAKQNGTQFHTMPNSMNTNKQLLDACPALHSNLLSACRLIMVTSLPGKCALHTALKVLISTNYTNIFDGNGYLAMYSMTKFTNDCFTLKPDKQVEQLIKE
jgi:hypothetical protein